VKNVSFKLHEGEVVGIAGLVGSGRSELAHVIFGSETAESGDIEVFGRRLNPRKPSQAISAGVALLPEDRRAQGAVLAMKLRENLTLASITRFRVSRFLPLLRLGAEKRDSSRWINDLRIRARGTEQPLVELSGGNQQKVILGKWLSSHARILMFDEPTQGIDVGSKAEIYNLMDNLASEGKSVIFISSDLEELSRVCKRILVMREGELVADLIDADETQILAYCFGGMNGSPSEGGRESMTSSATKQAERA
jgi:ABC-type sugar transport system ATPase subunit